jgi:hypothetical protein
LPSSSWQVFLSFWPLFLLFSALIFLDILCGQGFSSLNKFLPSSEKDLRKGSGEKYFRPGQTDYFYNRIKPEHKVVLSDGLFLS